MRLPSIKNMRTRTRWIAGIVILFLVLYFLGACDTFLVKSGLPFNFYTCIENNFSGAVRCSGPLAP